jgi:biopolymer transport protein ExbB
MGLRLAVAVTLLSCLLVFSFARVHRADSQRDVTAIENNLIFQKQFIDGDDSSNETESSFPSAGVTTHEKISGKFKTLLQKTSLIHIFQKGGPIMWPLLFASVLAMGTVIERAVFLLGEQHKRDPKVMKVFFEAVGRGETERAVRISDESKFYVVRVLGYALTHRGKSQAGALLYAQERELKRFRRGIPMLDMVITLAPLLGLLGTVTGMMGSFSLIGGELSTPGAITGGIAEALIATAFGLGIAITALIPFNLINTRMEKARLEIESAATQLELLTHPPASTATSAIHGTRPGQPVKGKNARSRIRIPISLSKGQ